MLIFFKKKFGFSIVEITVVIFIVALGLLGVLSLATQNIKVSNLNKNEFIASMLAQECLELVRNVRDTNWLTQGNEWDKNISDGSGGYTFSIYNNTSSNIILVDSSVSDIDDAGAKLKINGGYYGHSALGGDTVFSRLAAADDQGDYLNIDCEVKWNERGNSYNYIASTELWDWR